MATVYVVTAGCYSDYHIEGIFDTREGAKALLEDLKWEGGYDNESAEVMEWELNAARPQRFIEVEMERDGAVAWIRHRLKREVGFRSFFDNHLCWVVATDDEKRAIKVTNEKRTIILALNIWGDYDKVKQMVK